eukprot:GEMP01037735.1.p1 GENE.GEMP01037735.1~~GEMP01037735.1.p1  ORF type:complete len:387 (+),score=82.47 GEMP01037735.1:60-1220(+)
MARMARAFVDPRKAYVFKPPKLSPSVFSDAIIHYSGPEQLTPCSLEEATGELLGTGMYNPYSPYRVRLFSSSFLDGKDLCAASIETVITHRLENAAELRKQVVRDTEAYRLFHYEGDGLSGLAVDVLGEYAVIYSCAAWVEAYREFLMDEVAKLTKRQVVWKQRRDALAADGVPSERIEKDTDLPTAKFTEGGLMFEADINHKKTGWFCDQRDNRAILGSFALADKVVWDVCSYTGAFAIVAKSRGARQVYGFDVDAKALERAERNARLNDVNISWMHRDATNFTPPEDGAAPDVIILDPPSVSNADALRGLNESFMRRLAPNGLLFTFTCSPKTAETFDQTIEAAVANVGRRSRVLRAMQAGPDHPFSFFYPHCRYLAGLIVHIE